MFADNSTVVITFKKKKNPPIGNGVGHAPMHLPIEVTFDDATGVLTVQAPEDMDGVVYVCNVNGTPEASSDHLNATFTLTSPGLHIVSIRGEDWIGEGRFIHMRKLSLPDGATSGTPRTTSSRYSISIRS